jgi:hypothetical protein
MQVNSVASSISGSYQASGSKSFAKVQQDFQNLGDALQAGNLADAKKAFDQLKTDAPVPTGNQDDPLSAAMDSLGKALDAGDLKAAQKAYSQIQDAISQKASAGGRGGPGSRASGGGTRPSGSGGSSQSSKTYDKKDTNQDGTVSAQEEMAYDLAHPTEATNNQQTMRSSSSAVNTGAEESIDFQA